MPARAELQLRPRGAVEFGFDSFAQVYRLTDFVDASLAGTLRDTTDVFTEARVAAEFGVVGEGERWQGDLRGRLGQGTESRRGELRLDLGYRGTGHRLDLDLELEGRQFAEDTGFSLSSDVAEARLRAHFQRNVREGWALGLRSRVEAVRYERTSPFELDTQRFDLAVTSEIRQGLGQWFDLELGGGHRAVPDSGAIAYDRAFASAEYVRELGPQWRLSLLHYLERRVYADARERSAFTDATLEPELQLRLDDGWELRWTSSLEWVDFDEANEVYFDMFLGRTGLALVHRRGWWEFAAEPRFSWLRSPAPVEDEFGQSSVVVRVDWFGTGRLWFSLSEEIGHRDYRAEAPGELDLYSDYWFLRTTLLASYRVSRWASLDVFLSDEPESHRRDADDARLTLFNANLRLTF